MISTRGGGGGTAIVYSYWVCAPRETPYIHSPKFPLQSILFSQLITNNNNKKSTPAHHHFTFTWASIAVHRHPRVGILQPGVRGSVPGLQPTRVPARPRPIWQSPFRRPAFSCSSSLRSPAFSRSTRSRAHPSPPPLFTLT